MSLQLTQPRVCRSAYEGWRPQPAGACHQRGDQGQPRGSGHRRQGFARALHQCEQLANPVSPSLIVADHSAPLPALPLAHLVYRSRQRKTSTRRWTASCNVKPSTIRTSSYTQYSSTENYATSSCTPRCVPTRNFAEIVAERVTPRTCLCLCLAVRLRSRLCLMPTRSGKDSVYCISQKGQLRGNEERDGGR